METARRAPEIWALLGVLQCLVFSVWCLLFIVYGLLFMVYCFVFGVFWHSLNAGGVGIHNPPMDMYSDLEEHVEKAATRMGANIHHIN